MAHIRTQIRDNAKDLISTALPAVSVVIGRVKPAEKAKVLHIGIYTTTEATRQTDMGGDQDRVVSLRIDMALKGDEAVALDGLDAAAVLIEQAFANDPGIGGAASESEYRGVTIASVNEGEKPFFVMSMAFDVLAYTNNADPEHLSQ